MEIRTLEAGEREALFGLLEGAGPTNGMHGATSMRRRVELDPTFSEDDVWVAREGDELIACARIFPRRLRILGHEIPTGGLGMLVTRPSHRGRGIAGELLEATASAMRERGLELSIVFSDRAGLFGRFGWHPWTGQRCILRRGEKRAPAANQAPRPGASEPSIELVEFEHQRDRALSAVQAIHSSYSGSRNGSVVRDDRLWEASLALAGDPAEEFLVARRDGLAVAYARASLRGEGLTITEFGRFEDGASALARLLARLLEERDDDPLVTEGRTSSQVRSSLILPTFDDISLTVCLEHEGISSHSLDDDRGLIRCLDLEALAARMDVDRLEGEDGTAFMQRILPPDGFVFWPADHF